MKHHVMKSWLKCSITSNIALCEVRHLEFYQNIHSQYTGNCQILTGVGQYRMNASTKGSKLIKPRDEPLKDQMIERFTTHQLILMKYSNPVNEAEKPREEWSKNDTFLSCQCTSNSVAE